MIFDDKESPQFAFNDPSELYNLINRQYASNADPGYTDFKQAEDMINYSNPDEHPDWAKEVHEKRGVTFTSPAPTESPVLEQDSSDKTPNIPELFNKLTDLKNKKVSPSLDEDLEEEPSRSIASIDRSPSSIFSIDKMYEMAKPAKYEYKSPQTIQKEKELGQTQAVYDSYIQQGINDSQQILPLVDKIVKLKEDLRNPEPTKAEPPAIKKQPEAASEPSSIRSKLDLDKDWEEIAAGISGAVSNKMMSSGLPNYNPLSAEDAQTLFNKVIPGDNISPFDRTVKVTPDRIPLDRPVSKISSADDRITRLEQKSEQDKQDQARELEELANLKRQEDEANKKALYEAQADAAEYRKYQAILSGINKIGAGISGAIGKTKIEVPELEPIFEKAADQRMKDYKDRVAMEQEDPDSLYSKSFRNFAKPLVKKLNMNPMVLEGLSGKQIADILPHVKSMYDTQVTAEYRRQIAEDSRAERALRREEAMDTKENLKTLDRFDKAGKLLNASLAAGRSQFGREAQTLASTQNVRALLEGRNPDEIDKRELVETAKVLDRVLSGGTATISGTKELTPDTARKKVGEFLEFIGNKRVGAGAGDFVNRTMKNLEREERLATERLKATQRQILTSYSDLQKKDPEKWNLMMRERGLPDNPFEEQKSAPKLGPDEVMGRDSKSGRPVILNKKTKKVRWAD